MGSWIDDPLDPEKIVSQLTVTVFVFYITLKCHRIGFSHQDDEMNRKVGGFSHQPKCHRIVF